MVFSKAKSSYVKNGNTMKYNPQKTEGKPYKQKSRRMSENWKGGLNNIITDNKDGSRHPKTIQKFNRDKGFHPTQKPVALLEYLIKTYTNEGDTVLDNCAGSMSTVIASINTNRNCIAIEKDKKYFEIGKKRVIEHLKTNNISANLVIFDNECAI